MNMNMNRNLKRLLLALALMLSLGASVFAPRGASLAQQSTPTMAAYRCWKCGGSGS